MAKQNPAASEISTTSYTPTTDLAQTLGEKNIRWKEVFTPRISDGEGTSFTPKEIKEAAAIAANRNHNELTNESRSAPNSHPIEAVTGLADALSPATSGKNGSMAAADKHKLDNIDADKIVYKSEDGGIRFPQGATLAGATALANAAAIIGIDYSNTLNVGDNTLPLNLQASGVPTVTMLNPDYDPGDANSAMMLYETLALSSDVTGLVIPRADGTSIISDANAVFSLNADAAFPINLNPHDGDVLTTSIPTGSAATRQWISANAFAQKLPLMTPTALGVAKLGVGLSINPEGQLYCEAAAAGDGNAAFHGDLQGRFDLNQHDGGSISVEYGVEDDGEGGTMPRPLTLQGALDEIQQFILGQEAIQQTITGDGVETSWVIEHNRNSTRVLVQAFSVATGKQVWMDPEITTNSVTLSTPEPLADGYEVTVNILAF
jgi:hypothetical protein